MIVETGIRWRLVILWASLLELNAAAADAGARVVGIDMTSEPKTGGSRPPMYRSHDDRGSASRPWWKVKEAAADRERVLFC